MLKSSLRDERKGGKGEEEGRRGRRKGKSVEGREEGEGGIGE